jgi:hypothetical protein
MFIVVEHHATDPDGFRAATSNATIPDHLTLHQVLPFTDGVRSVCLWEGPSEEAVRSYVEGGTAAYSRNTYLQVATEHALGLPAPRE